MLLSVAPALFLDARVVPPDEVVALGLPLLPVGEPQNGLVLVCDENRLRLELREGKRRTRLVIDFSSGALQYRAKLHLARSEMLVRACAVPNAMPNDGGTPWRIVDATAGLGRDAFLLGMCGADVTLLERNPVLALLLENALQAFGGTKDSSLPRLHLIAQDAVPYLRALSGAARSQVVYCDPMFPPRKKSAAVSGEMQILHRLVGDTPDTGDLIAAALHAATHRVVVKRPLRAEPLRATGLAHIHPNYALEGRASRFDVYLIETLPL